jgi:F-type H+-transporting ATPase subunit beta
MSHQTVATADLPAPQGRVVAVRGAVLDVAFDDEAQALPAVNEALHIAGPQGALLLAEVQAHLGPGLRALALGSTTGLRRGGPALATGAPITVPVGEAVLGRLLDVAGQTGDHGAPLPPETPRWPIHRQPPPLAGQTGATDLFMTGIKVIDLLTRWRRAARRRCSAAQAWAKPCW